jgi:hypothetical protein
MKSTKISKVLAASAVLCLFSFFWSLKSVLSPRPPEVREKRESTKPAGKNEGSPPTILDPYQPDKIRNFFFSALAELKMAAAAPGQAPPTATPLGKNEIRDQETGAVYKFLGTSRDGDTAFAFFMKVGAVEKNEMKYVILPKGGRLSKKIGIEDVGEKWVRVRQNNEKILLKVFDVEIKTAVSKPQLDIK